MGAFDKLAFWKKRDEALGDQLGLPEALPPDIGAMPADEVMQDFPQQRPFQQQFQQPAPQSLGQQQSFRQDRDMELIAAKLDAINAKLQSIEQRIANIERIAYGEEQNSRYKGRF